MFSDATVRVPYESKECDRRQENESVQKDKEKRKWRRRKMHCGFVPELLRFTAPCLPHFDGISHCDRFLRALHAFYRLQVPL